MNYKPFVRLMCLLLIEKNGKTNTLEIKNALYALFSLTDPSFKPVQSEVSAAMKEIAREENLEKNLFTGGGFTYYEFSKPAPVDPNIDDDGNSHFPAGSALLPDDGLASPVITNSLVAMSSSIPANFGPQLDLNNGGWVAYERGNPSLFVQGYTEDEVRREGLARLKGRKSDAKGDDLNRCSTIYFNKKYMAQN